MKLTPFAAVATLLLLILTWLLTGGLNLNSARYDRELRASGRCTDSGRLYLSVINFPDK